MELLGIIGEQRSLLQESWAGEGHLKSGCKGEGTKHILVIALQEM